ncbi:unnamed protein product [Paramecium sonneborni]|uniref:Uncharacterized protein n=1 Tax=Paramecium sonneborni TaxID=65129 RepID=A0A8S1M0Q3_9CILI|nr:unnamed protein product [Paramecium sonneborni]
MIIWFSIEFDQTKKIVFVREWCVFFQKNTQFMLLSVQNDVKNNLGKITMFLKNFLKISRFRYQINQRHQNLIQEISTKIFEINVLHRSTQT